MQDTIDKQMSVCVHRLHVDDLLPGTCHYLLCRKNRKHLFHLTIIIVSLQIAILFRAEKNSFEKCKHDSSLFRYFSYFVSIYFAGIFRNLKLKWIQMIWQVNYIQFTNNIRHVRNLNVLTWACMQIKDVARV